jgi:hypothetical protein
LPDTFKQPSGSTSQPSWSEFYADEEKTLHFQNTVQAHSSVPAVSTLSRREVRPLSEFNNPAATRADDDD